MTTETSKFSNSVHKLFRGLRHDVPDYTEDDYKQRVPKSGRVCTNVRPLYSEPAIRFCPKYGCVYKRKITGHVIDFLDLKTLELTQVYQKNAYDGFWDVYDGPFKPSLSKRGTLKDEASEVGAAGEPNKGYDKKKKCEKEMRKQLNTQAYYQPKLNSKSKAELMQLATFTASNDHSGTPRVRDGQRPIKANLEILTSLSLSYDNSDGSQKSVPAKLIHLALSWENNDRYDHEPSKKKHDQDKDENKAELRQPASPQLFPDQSKTSGNNMAHGTKKVELLQINTTKALDNDHPVANKKDDDIVEEQNNTEITKLASTSLAKANRFDSFNDRDDMTLEADNAVGLQQVIAMVQKNDHSGTFKAGIKKDQGANNDELLQLATTRRSNDDHSDTSQTRDDTDQCNNKVNFLELAATATSTDDHSGASKTKDHMGQSAKNVNSALSYIAREFDDGLIDQSKTIYEVVQSTNKTEHEEQVTQFGTTDISKEKLSNYVKSQISVEHEVIVCSEEPNDCNIYTSETKHCVDNIQTQSGTKELQTPKESGALNQKVTLDLYSTKSESQDEPNTLETKDIDNLQYNQKEIGNDSENLIFDIINNQAKIIGEYDLITHVSDEKVSLKTDICQTDNSKHLNNETATTEIENDTLKNDLIPENSSIIYEYSFEHKETEEVENNDFMTGILGIYARGQELYILDNYSTKYKGDTDDDVVDDDDDDDDDTYMSGLFGIFSRGC